MRAAAWVGSVGALYLVTTPVFSFCFTWIGEQRESKLSGESNKGTNPIYEGSTVIISYNPNYFTKTSPPNISH